MKTDPSFLIALLMEEHMLHIIDKCVQLAKFKCAILVIFDNPSERHAWLRLSKNLDCMRFNQGMHS